MPIVALLRDQTAFTPEEVSALTAAFEDTCRDLGLADRADPLVELVAKKVIKIALTGERDPVRLKDLAIAAIRL